MPGRVGDTPIVGAGGYADNQVRLHTNIFSLQDIFLSAKNYILENKNFISSSHSMKNNFDI
jgi:hypothetical protein